MTQYIITHCTAPDDATAIARNNASAFWEDPNWRYSWQHYTLERLVAAFVQRTPRNLLRDRDVLRHFRAVDPATGRLVGYIRWRLPAGRCWEGRQGDGVEEQVPAWPEGQTPDVSAEEREEFEKRAVGADWNPIDYGEEELDHALVPIKNRLLAKKEYLILEHFAVHPESQRKGVGSALLQHGIRKAREMGMDIFVMAFVGGFKLYENEGFKLLDSIVQDATKFGGDDNYAVRFLELEAGRQSKPGGSMEDVLD